MVILNVLNYYYNVRILRSAIKIRIVTLPDIGLLRISVHNEKNLFFSQVDINVNVRLVSGYVKYCKYKIVQLF